jgi:hypothetical protein
MTHRLPQELIDKWELIPREGPQLAYKAPIFGEGVELAECDRYGEDIYKKGFLLVHTIRGDQWRSFEIPASLLNKGTCKLFITSHIDIAFRERL